METLKLITIGKVLQSGTALTVGEGYVYNGSWEKRIARMTATMITVEDIN